MASMITRLTGNIREEYFECCLWAYLILRIVHFVQDMIFVSGSSPLKSFTTWSVRFSRNWSRRDWIWQYNHNQECTHFIINDEKRVLDSAQWHNLVGWYLPNARLGDADLSDVKIHRADLSNIDFPDADLSCANFGDDIRGVKMSTARLYQITMNSCKARYDTESCLFLLGAHIHSDDESWTDDLYVGMCACDIF